MAGGWVWAAVKVAVKVAEVVAVVAELVGGFGP